MKYFNNFLLGIGVGVIIRGLFVAFTKTKVKAKAPTKIDNLLQGSITKVTVVSPVYTDPKRIGARINFTLCLWGTGNIKIKIKKAVVNIFSNGVALVMWERSLFRDPVEYNFIFHKGFGVPFKVAAYVDDVKPEAIDCDSLMVVITDTMEQKYTIEVVH